MDKEVRTTVYVDGFDLVVHYFTALIRPDGPKDCSPDRQKLYIKALERCRPSVRTHYGHFLIYKAKGRAD